MILTRIPAGIILKCIKVGLLTHPVYRAFPAFASGKECDKPKLLFIIGAGYTATGIVPDSHRIPFSPFGQQCGVWAPCALQKYVIRLIPTNIFMEFLIYAGAYIFDIKFLLV